MADNPDRNRAGQPGMTGLLGWLGFFLLVFAVAGVGFYLSSDSGDGVPNRPTLATQR